MAARGVLTRTGVRIPGTLDANRLQTKGNFGQRGADGELEVSFEEAIFLVRTNRLELPEDVDLRHLVEGAQSTGVSDSLLLAFLDLRGRSLAVQREDHRLLVMGRGDEPDYYTVCHDEEQPIELDALEHCATIVDEEGNVRHYQFEAVDPRGQAPAIQFRGGGARIGSKVFVTVQLKDLEAAGYGVPWFEGRLLGSMEAANIGLSSPRSNHLQAAYDDLRARGLIPRSGFQYGAHFRAYENDVQSEHARYLVLNLQVETPTWQSLARAVRLSHGVRKELLLQFQIENKFRYYLVQRFKP